MFTVKLVLTVEKITGYNEENIIFDRNLYMYGTSIVKDQINIPL